MPTLNGEMPDLRVGGRYVEVKTPLSLNKVTNRLAKAAKQLKSVGVTQGEVILGISRLGADGPAAVETAQRFVDDGTFSQVTVLNWPEKHVLTKK